MATVAAESVTDGVDWSAPLASLIADGYHPVEEFTHRGRTLRVGQRVHHIGEKWAAAQDQGTAILVAITRHRPPSSWEQSYGRPDVEVIAVTDQDRYGTGRIGRWADYHTVIAHDQPEATDA